MGEITHWTNWTENPCLVPTFGFLRLDYNMHPLKAPGRRSDPAFILLQIYGAIAYLVTKPRILSGMLVELLGARYSLCSSREGLIGH